MNLKVQIAAILIIGISCITEVSAKEKLTSLPDSLPFKKEIKLEDPKKPMIFIDLSTGLLINKTFGIHPIINLAVGYKNDQNKFSMVYEGKFGNSNKSYQIMENDTLKNTKAYKGKYFGLEYQRLLFRNSHHEIYSIVGPGVDWLQVEKNETIRNSKTLSALAFNIGIGYTFYLGKKHGPNIELIYHWADYKNKGTVIDNNSALIRLSYK